MQNISSDTRRFIELVGTQTGEFLANETGIEPHTIEYHFHDVQRLKLCYVTSIMAVEAPFQVLFAFSFDRSLAHKITQSYTAELDVSEDDIDEFVEETTADIINIILGNTLVNFQISGKSIELTPPIVITEAKTIYRNKPAQFLTAEIHTEFGNMQICCIGPKQLFDSELNYKSKT